MIGKRIYAAIMVLIDLDGVETAAAVLRELAERVEAAG
jgi:hypothetical protein